VREVGRRSGELRAGVEGGLDLGVGEARDRPHPRQLDARGHGRAGVVEVDGPHVGGAHRTGQEGGGVGGEDSRVERERVAGTVDGDTAGPDLGVQGAAGFHEPPDGGDRVPHARAGAAGLEVDGLVEVHGTGRIDGDERDGCAVLAGLGTAGGGRGVGLRLGGEALGDLEFGTELAEGHEQIVGGDGGVQVALGHEAASGVVVSGAVTRGVAASARAAAASASMAAMERRSTRYATSAPSSMPRTPRTMRRSQNVFDVVRALQPRVAIAMAKEATPPSSRPVSTKRP